MSSVSTAKGKYFNSTRIAFIAVFGALAGVLYIFDFPITGAFPSFLKFKLSDIPVLLGTFTLGPASGSIIVTVQILIKLVVKGTSTSFVGELSDLLTSVAFAVTAGLLYKRNRTFKGALVAMAAGTAVEVTVAIFANWLILVPFYAKNFGWKAIIGMMKPLFPNITQENFYNYYLWVSVLPFNLMRCIAAILVTLPVYKRISNLINRANDKMTPKNDEDGQKTKKVNIGVLVAGIAVVAILLTFALLRGFKVI